MPVLICGESSCQNMYRMQKMSHKLSC